MSAGAQARLLPDGRLHLQHGPIDLVIGAVDSLDSRSGLMLSGTWDLSHEAYRSATARFATILDELCDELPALRSSAGCHVRGTAARHMLAAVRPYAAETFVTPMAAVAGAVADEILRVMTEAAPLRRAFVNNGGDIAIHLAPGETTRIGLVDRPDRPSLFGTASLCGTDGVGGIATSGWRGRSFSLGIADAVTVLARTTAEADAAATIIANAVDLPGHPAVTRRPARQVQEDSDLKDRLVTRDVGQLSDDEIAEALRRGRARAEALRARGLIKAAALHLQGVTTLTSWPGSAWPSTKAAETKHRSDEVWGNVGAWMAVPGPAMTAERAA